VFAGLQITDIGKGTVDMELLVVAKMQVLTTLSPEGASQRD